MKKHMAYKKYIAYCGLDCEICEARMATVRDDDGMRERIAKEWSELNGAEITPGMINCEGCRMDGVKTPYCGSLCRIRQCAMAKEYETCADCSLMETCGILGMVTGNNAEALRNLKGG